MLVNHNPWSFDYNTGTATYYGQSVDPLTGQGSYNPYGGLYTGVPAAMQHNASQNSLHNQSWNVAWMGVNQRNSHHENIARPYIGNQSVAMAAGAQPTLGNMYLKDPYYMARLKYELGVLPPNDPLYGYAQQQSIQQHQQYNQQYAQANQQISQYFDQNGINDLYNNFYGQSGSISTYNGNAMAGIDFQPSHNIPQTINGNANEFGNFISNFTGVQWS